MLDPEFQVFPKHPISPLNEIVFDDGLHPYPSEVPRRSAETLDKGPIVFFFLVYRVIGRSSYAEHGQRAVDEHEPGPLLIKPAKQLDIHHIAHILPIQSEPLVGIAPYEPCRMCHPIL